MSSIARLFPLILLAVNGVLYLYVAWLFISDPVDWFAALDVRLSRGSVGYTELQSVYAGLMAAMGLFFVLCAWRPTWREPGLVFMLLSYAGLVLMRSNGILIEQSYNTLILQIYIAEWLALLLAIVALFLQRRA